MFIKAGYKLINTEQVTDIDVYPAVEAGFDEIEGEYPAQPTRLTIYTTGNSYDEIGYSHPTVVPGPRIIYLSGEDAEEFLRQIYSNVAKHLSPTS